jgi:hypothetical protein
MMTIFTGLSEASAGCDIASRALLASTTSHSDQPNRRQQSSRRFGVFAAQHDHPV